MKNGWKFQPNPRHSFTKILTPWLLHCLAGCISLLSALSTAQGLPPPPEVSMRDDMGVDLISGYSAFTLDDLQIGNGISSLSHTIAAYNNYFWGFRDSYDLEVHMGGDGYVMFRAAAVGHKSQAFYSTSGTTFGYATYAPRNGDGALLEQVGDNTFKYTMADGTVATTHTSPREIIYPNGYSVKIYKREGRIQSVVSNTGLQFKYEYRSNSLPTSPTEQQRADFSHPVRIIAINNAIEYCNPEADSCAYAHLWPTVTYAWPSYSQMFTGTSTSGTFTVTDAIGRKTSYLHKGYSNNINSSTGGTDNRIYQVKAHTSDGYVATSTYDYAHLIRCISNFLFPYQRNCHIEQPNVVYKASRGGASWTYQYGQPNSPYVAAGGSTGPKGVHTVVMNGDGKNFKIGTVTSPDGIEGKFNQDQANLLASVTAQGKHFAYSYTRANINQVTQSATAGSPEAGTFMITRAEYPATCTNLKTCNKPLWIRDAKGNQTDYTYYEEHGGIKTITQAPDSAWVRAQTRYKYNQYYAWYKNASGALARAATPVWLLAEESLCTEGNAAGDGCADPSKLVVTRYTYGLDGTPNNLWLRGIEQSAGGTTLRTCYQYDNYGNRIAETAPKAGLSSCQ